MGKPVAAPVGMTRGALDRYNARRRLARSNNPRKIAGQVLEAKRAFIRAIKIKCFRCDETHPAALDFHHRDPTTKIENIGTMVNKMWSLERLKEEVLKCDVLCCNCHRKLHWGGETKQEGEV